MNDDQITDRARAIRESIDNAARRTGRSPGDVEILPITKGHAPQLISAVAAAGFEAVGENRVAEAEAKLEALGRAGVRWHMVGHLQRNKAGRAVAAFDLIESVDSVRLARRLQAEAERLGREVVPILVQVNAGGEEHKSGLDPERLVEAVGAMLELDRIGIRGLMTMAPFTSEERVLRRTFTTARECLARCRRELASFDGETLSMGMSNDFEIAVEEGSTEVRLGTALLGERPEERWT